MLITAQWSSYHLTPKQYDARQTKLLLLLHKVHQSPSQTFHNKVSESLRAPPRHEESTCALPERGRFMPNQWLPEHLCRAAQGWLTESAFAQHPTHLIRYAVVIGYILRGSKKKSVYGAKGITIRVLLLRLELPLSNTFRVSRTLYTTIM